MHPIEQQYAFAREQYAALGVDTEAALETLTGVPISLHCWQGDDVTGFENAGDMAGSGLAVTGGHPGRARTADELRTDMERVFRLVPGSHRVNLHAIYAETGGVKVDRDALAPEHFARWIDWAKAQGLGLDFNPTFFAHPLAADGLTLSHPDKGIREFWVRHGQVCRVIGAAMGKALGTPTVVNVWIPDGMKDLPADRLAPRKRLSKALDDVFASELPRSVLVDAVESKLFGIGSESYVVGSHEFYMGYAMKHHKCLCLDSGHFHPTESIADKISSVMLYVDEVLLHVSRGIRWDSDHVVIFNDELRALAEELVRGDFLPRVHIGLDYFDASINRVAAWTIGMRSMAKALLVALLEPRAALLAYENAGDLAGRLALLEECKTLPFGAVWDAYCLRHDVPVGPAWYADVQGYEREVLAAR
jgi:L-rhamnose isomerase